jgi:phosphoglycolate phosphatase
VPHTGKRNDRDFQGATIVFDLDGTIADTSPDLIDAANAALMAEGLPLATAEAIKAGVGYGTKAMLQCALSSRGKEADPEQMRRLAARLVEHYEENIAVKTRLFPGFLGAAQELRATGAALALCTNKRERLALKLLAALGIDALFDSVAGGDTFAFQKPDPRHITELIRRMGGNPGTAVMIGDSEADVAASKAASIPVIAVGFGYATVPAEKLRADAILNHFDDLPRLIDSLFLKALMGS